MAGPRHPAPAALAAGPRRGRRVHRRRRLHRPVDRLLPQPGRRPRSRIVVLEATFAGYGASGRNGGWVTAAAARLAAPATPGARGAAGVRDLRSSSATRWTRSAAGLRRRGHRRDLVKGGKLTVATSAAQQARLRAPARAANAPGATDADVVRYLDARDLDGRVQRARRARRRCTRRTAPACSPPRWSPGWPRAVAAGAACRSTRRPR